MAILKFDKIVLSGWQYSRLLAIRGRYHPKVRGYTLTEYKKDWGWRTKIAWNEAGQPKYDKPIIITPYLFRWNSKYWYDSDNLWHGLKPVVDFLVKFGMIINDTQDLVKHGIPVWHKDRDERMILEIEEFKQVLYTDFSNKPFVNINGREDECFSRNKTFYTDKERLTEEHE